MNKNRLDLQFFAEGLNDLLGYLGIEQAPTNTDPIPNTDPNPNDQKPEGAEGIKPEQNPDEGKDPNAEQNDGAENKPTDDDAKKNYAFEKLRRENSQNKQILSGLQRLLKIPDNTPLEDVMGKVQEALVKAESKETGVPEELITKINNLEKNNKEFEAHQLQENAYLGFNKVQTKFNLPKEKIGEFAKELLDSGINPFEQKVDIVREYQLRHFDDIIQAKTAEAIRAEQERAAKASNHSTTPNAMNGQKQGETQKINSVKELDKWFEENKK